MHLSKSKFMKYRCKYYCSVFSCSAHLLPVSPAGINAAVVSAASSISAHQTVRKQTGKFDVINKLHFRQTGGQEI